MLEQKHYIPNRGKNFTIRTGNVKWKGIWQQWPEHVQVSWYKEKVNLVDVYWVWD